MDSSETLVTVLLIVFVLYGIGSFIAAVVIPRRFYREIGFIGQGASQLELPTDSELLAPLATSNLYDGQYQGHTIKQCKAHPVNRRKFTLSAKRRKFNQSRWCVTFVTSEIALPSFCLLPTADVSTALMMLHDPGVDLADDTAFVGRYYLRTENPNEIKSLIYGNIREFLFERDLISIECVDNTVVIKRTWPVEKHKLKLLADLKCSVAIVEELNQKKINPEYT